MFTDEAMEDEEVLSFFEFPRNKFLSNETCFGEMVLFGIRTDSITALVLRSVAFIGGTAVVDMAALYLFPFFDSSETRIGVGLLRRRSAVFCFKVETDCDSFGTGGATGLKRASLLDDDNDAAEEDQG